MASIEYITKRVEGKEKEIAKLTKKLERIEKAQATNWEVNPYYYDEHDLKVTTRDLEQAMEALKKLQAQLTEATEKANSRNVKAILEFLEDWKARTRKFYGDSIPRYQAAVHEYSEKERELDWYRYSGEERKQIKAEWNRLRREFHEAWGYMEHYMIGSNFEWERFERDLKNDADAKYDNIIERTNAICGTITDAAGLRVGDKGELDGYVIGERGTAHVHTIGAGGYNIQCFHFRVLVHEVR